MDAEMEERMIVALEKIASSLSVLETIADDLDELKGSFNDFASHIIDEKLYVRGDISTMSQD